MTAFAMIRLADRIITAADGASYVPTGEIAGFKSKMFHIPHLSTTLVCQGPSILLPYVSIHLAANTRTFEDLLDHIPAKIRHAYDDVNAEMKGWAPFYLGIGGYSGVRERFESYYLRSIDQQESGPFSLPGAAWELMPAPEFFAAPWPDATACARVNAAITPPTERFLIDAEMFALKAVAGARFSPSEGEHGTVKGRTYVGGFLEVALTMRDFAQSRIVHRWPDRINEPIDPNDGEPLPPDLLAAPIFILDPQQP